MSVRLLFLSLPLLYLGLAMRQIVRDKDPAVFLWFAILAVLVYAFITRRKEP